MKISHREIGKFKVWLNQTKVLHKYKLERVYILFHFMFTFPCVPIIFWSVIIQNIIKRFSSLERLRKDFRFNLCAIFWLPWNLKKFEYFFLICGYSLFIIYSVDCQYYEWMFYKYNFNTNTNSFIINDISFSPMQYAKNLSTSF